MPEILKISVAIRHVTVKLKTAKVEIFQIKKINREKIYKINK